MPTGGVEILTRARPILRTARVPLGHINKPLTSTLARTLIPPSAKQQVSGVAAGVGHPGTGRMVKRRIFSPRKANPKVSETGLPGKSPAISAMARWPSSVGSTLFTV